MALKLVTSLLLSIPYVYSAMLSDQKLLVLNRHNFLRAKVANGRETLGGGQPPASDMNELVWDEELADVAQAYADYMLANGHWGHNSARGEQFGSKSPEYVPKKNGQGTPYVGENLGMSWSSGSSISYTCVSATNSWYNEVKDYNYTSNSGGGAVVGHYTQLVWAETRYLGCGIATGYSSVNSRYEAYCVCNYHMAGNFNGRKPYAQATSTGVGLSCPKDRTKVTTGDNAGLCGGHLSVNFYPTGLNGDEPYLTGNGIGGFGNSGGSTPNGEPTPAPTPRPTKKPSPAPTPAPVVAGSDDYICIACMDTTRCPGRAFIGTYKKDDDNPNDWKHVDNELFVFNKYGSSHWVLWLITKTVSGSTTSYSYSFQDYDYQSVHPNLKDVVLDATGKKLYVKNLGWCPQSYSGETDKGITYLFKDTTTAVLIVIVIIQCILLTIGAIVCITQKINKKKLKDTSDTSPYHQL